MGQEGGGAGLIEAEAVAAVVAAVAFVQIGSVDLYIKLQHLPVICNRPNLLLSEAALAMTLTHS